MERRGAAFLLAGELNLPCGTLPVLLVLPVLPALTVLRTLRTHVLSPRPRPCTTAHVHGAAVVGEVERLSARPRRAHHFTERVILGRRSRGRGASALGPWNFGHCRLCRLGRLCRYAYYRRSRTFACGRPRTLRGRVHRGWAGGRCEANLDVRGDAYRGDLHMAYGAGGVARGRGGGSSRGRLFLRRRTAEEGMAHVLPSVRLAFSTSVRSVELIADKGGTARTVYSSYCSNRNTARFAPLDRVRTQFRSILESRSKTRESYVEDVSSQIDKGGDISSGVWV